MKYRPIWPVLRTLLVACGLAAVALGRAGAQPATAALAQIDSETIARPARATAPAAKPVAAVIYLTADEMPTFPGGDAAMLKFLSSKLNYPATALDRRLSGKVHVAFTVDNEGHLRDPHVVRGLGSGLDEEAVRLIRLMPWWNPGKIKGQPVWVNITMPIVFRAL